MGSTIYRNWPHYSNLGAFHILRTSEDLNGELRVKTYSIFGTVPLPLEESDAVFTGAFKSLGTVPSTFMAFPL